jgi:large subunit ribosomal protein L1
MKQAETTDSSAGSQQFNKADVYSLDEAIAWVKKLSKAKFDETVEIHLRLGIDTKKGDQQVRNIVSLPYGTGKKKIIAAFVTPDKEKEAKEAGADLVGGEEMIKEIKENSKTNFDIAVAQPEMMPKLASIAKILGQRGLMPNPKSGTVSPDIKKLIEELKKGKESFKNDETGNLHFTIGKVSFGEDKLKANVETFVAAVRKVKPASVKGVYLKSAVICSTMGPGIKVKV